MAHLVICKYCGQKFDRDKEPAIEVSARRYAHKVCYEKAVGCLSPEDKAKQDEEQDLKKLENYIMVLFDESFVSAKIRKQIADYRRDYGYTYSGILKTLQWWFDLNHHSIDDANDGIGIVPYVYKQACDYYYSLYLADIANEDFKNYKPEVVEITIKSPRVEKKSKRKFKLMENEND